MKNILCIIVDCLRYDRVVEEYMPKLYQWGLKHTMFPNHWATSHCTDPCITHILSGKHPDELQLYSMMYEIKDYTIPADVVMLPEIARAYGYSTIMFSNLGRWFQRGVAHYFDIRWRTLDQVYTDVEWFLKTKATKPWFCVFHTQDMHTNYAGGSYDRAAWLTDLRLSRLIEAVEDDTWILVTSDHGEGLGQKGIQQHGFGLWDFLTHVPLVTNMTDEIPVLSSHQHAYELLTTAIDCDDPVIVSDLGYVFQAGDTPPNHRHRGVVNEQGAQFIRHSRGGELITKTLVPEDAKWQYDPEFLLDMHCQQFDIDYIGEAMDSEVANRLRGLGYFDD